MAAKMVTRHPLVRPAVAMICGVTLASWWPLDGSPASAPAAICVLFLVMARRYSWAFFFLLGSALLTFRMLPNDDRDLRNIFGADVELVTVRGALNGDPEHRVLEQDRRTRYRTTARVSVSEVEHHGVWEPAVGDVAVSTSGFISDDFVSGAKVEVSGAISVPQGPIAPGLFDFERYLKWQRIFFVLHAEHTNDWKLAQTGGGWSQDALYRNFNAWAMRTLQRGIPADENTRLLWAMTLGWKPGLNNEISEPFMRTGTLHVFAVSGLHIGFMAGILVAVFRLFRAPRTWAGLLAIPVIWFYTGATGWQASAIRSTIMSTVVILGWILRRPNNLLNSLAASALIILCWQAEQLFQPGFQLSFLLLLTMAVWPAMWPNQPWPDPTFHLGQRADAENPFARKATLTWWSVFLARLYEKATGRDSMLPSELRPRWRQKLDVVFTWLFGGLNMSLAAFICALPVIAIYFNMISFSSFAANLVIVPLSGVALGAAMGSLATGWLPVVPECANWIAWGAMKLMVAICRFFESYHWTYTYVEAPSWAAVILYYIALTCLLKGWLKNWRVAVPLGAAVAAAIAVWIWREATTTTVTVLPGPGVIFVDAPWSARDFLIDCGRNREAMTVIKPFLHARGVDSLAGIVLTHGDIDHIEGYARIANEFSARKTFTSGANSRSPKYREILRELQDQPERWKKVGAGDDVFDWSVLHPPAGADFSRADDEAIVFRDSRILLLSDLGRIGQQSLAGTDADLRAAIVVCGVPNDRSSLRADLIEKINPRVVVIAAEEAKALKAARELRARGLRVITTAEQKAITIRMRNSRAVLEGMRGERMEF